MNNTENLDQDILASFDTKDFICLLSLHLYPQFFSRIDNITLSIRSLDTEYSVSQLLPLLRTINVEINELHRKEKFTLFPFLLQLDAESKKSDCCKPFKNVKIHYTTLLTATEALATATKAITNSPIDAKLRDTLVQQIRNFQKDLIHTQIQKEKYLFRKFRNCSGSCKSLSDD